MNGTRIALGAVALLAAAASWGQSGPKPIGLSDLMGGGWAKEQHYDPDPATKGAALKFKTESEHKQWQQSVARAQKGWGYATKGYGLAKQAYDLKTQHDDLMQEYQHLTPQDGAFDPNYLPPGTPQVPLQCAKSKECGACFENAQGKLNAVRVRFEKLRVVYGSTKAWIAKALSFGDTAAGAFGIGGLAWQTERRKVEASVANLDAAYDAKYAELMQTLEDAMKAIEACEAQHFNEPDWYNRFGFMYYSFMADRYRR